MAALQCEICGGKLMGRPGGIFECDSCGMEYDTAWAKQKIQEIKGTVKVEGTVQVAGTVKVEGGVSIENLLKKGRMALEDYKWEDAKKAFQDALDINAECGEAYLGQLLAEQKFTSFDAMLHRKGYFLMTHPSLKRALQFMNPADAKVLQDKLDARQRMLEEEEEEQRREREEKQRQEHQAQQQEQKEKQANCQRLATVRERIAPVQKWVSCHGALLTVEADGTVQAEKTISQVNDNCKVSSWRNIKAVSSGHGHSVGLHHNGTVVVTGHSKENAILDHGEGLVSGWKNIVDIGAGSFHTVGVTADGKVLAAGDNVYGQCNVSTWENVVAISACTFHTVGLKANGTVVATGENTKGQCNVSGWRDIVAISAGQAHTVGLKADGTVVAVGRNSEGQCNVHDWTDIVAVSAGDSHTVGLKADGTVVATGTNFFKQCDVHNWSNVVAVCGGYFMTFGITANGTLLSKGKYYPDATGKQLFNCLDTLPQELAAAAEKNKARVESLKAQKQQLQAELANLKGLFAGLKRKELEAQLDQINNEIKELS